MRLYAITDSALLSAGQQAAEDTLIALTSQWVEAGVEVIQIRERHMTSCALERLARRMISIRDSPSKKSPQGRTKILVNGRADVAIAAGADGVHLPGSGALTPAEVRQLYTECGRNPPILSMACHSIADVERARHNRATMAIFAPVFGKILRTDAANLPLGAEALPGVGLPALRAACHAARSMPIFALGGVNLKNAAACIEAGAAGIAAIRLFQSPEWQSLRG